MALRKKKRSPIMLISVGAHLALAAGIAFIPQQKLREVVAIALAETAKREEPKPPAPRKEPPKASRPARNVNALARAPVAQSMDVAPLQTGVASFKDIGIALDSNSADGLAIPMASVDKASVSVAAVALTKPKTFMSRKLEEACQEEVIKPIPAVVVRPEYTDEARDAKVEGRVRVELMVDEFGQVTTARVLHGLGYGLDEAALAAVKKMRFRPGTRCSKPLATPFVMAVRFLLGT